MKDITFISIIAVFKSMKRNLKYYWKKTWHFIWHEDSWQSWIVNVILAFLIIKYLVYPGLGLALTTSHPVVAVVSESMEHEGLNFDEFYSDQESFYADKGITKEAFADYDFKNGFNKGDIIFLKGKDPNNIEMGEIIVWWSARADPIIHRVVQINENDKVVFQTKGDNPKTNRGQIVLYAIPGKGFVTKGTPGSIAVIDETLIPQERVIGVAKFRLPFFGYVKIWFVQLLGLFGVESRI